MVEQERLYAHLGHPHSRDGSLFVAGLACYSPAAHARAEPITPGDILATSTPTSAQLPLFKPDQTYILLGSTTDLGVIVALWMYQVEYKIFHLISRKMACFA